MSTRVASSISAMSEESAAQNSARKKIAWKTSPPGMRAKSCGIQMNISPTLPARIASIASAGARMANAAGSTAMPASSEAE